MNSLLLSLRPAIETLAWLFQNKLCLQTYDTLQSSTREHVYFYSAKISTANRLFLGSNSPKPSHKYIPLGDPQHRGERAESEWRKSEVWEIRQLFPQGSFPRPPIFSVTKTTSNASRAVWLDEIPPARSGIRGKPADTSDKILRPRRAKRVDISFFNFLKHFIFIQIERTTNFSRGEKRALEDQLIAPQLIEKSQANLLHVSTEHTKIKRTNQTVNV